MAQPLEMRVEFGPNSIDEPSLLFKLQRKIKVFNTSDPLPNRGYNLVASSSKYGIVFIASPDGTLSSYQLNQLIDKEHEPLHLSTKLPEKPSHVAVSCDQELLAVTGGSLLTIYKIADFQNQNVSAVSNIPCGVQSAVSSLQWNPCIPDSIAIAYVNGILLVSQTSAGQTKKIQSKARCICWSPKGKQLVTGNSDGTLCQYKPDLTPAKLIPAPNLFEGAPVEALAIHWISTFQFAVVFRNASDDSRPAVTIVNTPKAGQPSCINYEDICYSMGTNRPWYYYLQGLAPWNIVLSSSSNSMEIATIGSADGANWFQWCQPDEARPELPLTDKKQENYPIGVWIDTCAIHQLPWGENEVLPHMPMLLVISQTGLLTIFNIININKQAPQVCSPPQLLTLPASAMTSVIPGEVSEPVRQTAQQAAPILVVPKPQPQSAQPPPSYHPPQSAPAFAPPAKPALVASTPQPVKPVPATQPVNIPPPVAQVSMIQPKPEAPKPQPPTREMTERTAELKAEQERVNKLKADQELRSMLIKEVNDFQMELYKFLVTTRESQIKFQKNIAAMRSDFNLHSLDHDQLQKDCSLEELRSAIIHLKLELVRACAVVAEARTQSDAKEQHQWTQSDPLTSKRVASVKQLVYYVQTQLEQAHQSIDHKWNQLIAARDPKLNKPGQRMIRPILEDVYQPLVKQQEILSRQQVVLKTLRNTLDECGDTPIFKSTSLLRQTPLRNKDPLSKLTKNILNMSIEPQTKEKQQMLTSQKLDALRDMLSNHKTVKIKPVNVELRQHLAAMRLNYEKSVKEKKSEEKKSESEARVEQAPKPVLKPVTKHKQDEYKQPTAAVNTPSFTPVNNAKFSGLGNVARTLFTDEPENEKANSLTQSQQPLTTKPTSAFGQKLPTSSQNSSAFGTSTPSFGQTAPSFGQTAPSFGQTAPSFGQTAPSFGQTAPSFGQTGPSSGQTAPSSGQTKPGYVQKAPAFGQSADFNLNKPLIGKSAEFNLNNPTFGQNVLTFGQKTPSFGQTSTQTSKSAVESQKSPTFAPTSTITASANTRSVLKEMLQNKTQANAEVKNDANTFMGQKICSPVALTVTSSAPPSTAAITGKSSMPNKSQPTAFVEPKTTKSDETGEPSKPEAKKEEKPMTNLFAMKPQNVPDVLKTNPVKLEAKPSQPVAKTEQPEAKENVPKSIETPKAAEEKTKEIKPLETQTVNKSLFETSSPTVSVASPFTATPEPQKPVQVKPVILETPKITEVLKVPEIKPEPPKVLESKPEMPNTPEISKPSATSDASSLFASANITPIKSEPSSPSSPAASLFATAVSSQPSDPKSLFNATSSASSLFGNAAASLPQTTQTGSIFGSPSSIFASAATTTSSSSIFGSPTQTSSSTFEKVQAVSPTASAFDTPASVFGATTLATTTASSLFASTTASGFGTSVFGSGFGSTTTSSVFSGSGSVFGTVSQSAFGGATATTQSSIFGSPATTQSAVFGAASSSPASVFGAANQASGFGTATTQASLFGSSPATQTSVFGSPSTQSAFGATTTASQGGSLFGTSDNLFASASISTTNAPSPTSGGSIFGSSPGSVFGGAANTNVFGNKASFGQNNATAASIFGSANTQKPATDFWAGGNNASGGFGSTGFGQQATTQSSSIFGGGTGGSFSTPTPAGQVFTSAQPSAFGSPQQSSPGFGAAPAFGAKPAFGQPAGFGSPTSGFGSFGGFNKSPGGGFGAPAAFGAPTTFGGAGFGGGSSPSQMFGAAATGFGSPTQQSNATFENLASQNTISFGNLAQQSGQQPAPAPSFNTSPSFTGWRG